MDGLANKYDLIFGPFRGRPRSQCATGVLNDKPWSHTVTRCACIIVYSVLGRKGGVPHRTTCRWAQIFRPWLPKLIHKVFNIYLLYDELLFICIVLFDRATLGPTHLCHKKAPRVLFFFLGQGSLSQRIVKPPQVAILWKTWLVIICQHHICANNREI